MTQKELSNELGFSPQYLSKVLKGQENLTLETIAKIQDVIEITLIQIPTFLSIDESMEENVKVEFVEV